MEKSLFTKKIKSQLSLLLLAGMITTLSTSLSAQDGGGSSVMDNIHYGAKVGATISSFTNQQPHNSIKLGLTTGLYSWYSFNETMAVQLEASYFQAGGRLLDFDYPKDLSLDTYYVLKTNNNAVTMHNIDIPLLFRYTYSLGDISVVGNLGCALGINMLTGETTETTQIADDGLWTTHTGETNITNAIERYNYAVTAGVGLEVPISKDYMVLVDLRYRYGLNTVYKSYSYRNIPQVNGDLKNHSFYVTVGFGI